VAVFDPKLWKCIFQVFLYPTFGNAKHDANLRIGFSLNDIEQNFGFTLGDGDPAEFHSHGVEDDEELGSGGSATEGGGQASVATHSLKANRR
tara:strand:+ start:7289 stop:7564 length:276 start_codon:yes stop_codon:yes gene_type:complete